MSAQSAQEPSMEDILASIRKIISEDSADELPANAANAANAPLGPKQSTVDEKPPMNGPNPSWHPKASTSHQARAPSPIDDGGNVNSGALNASALAEAANRDNESAMASRQEAPATKKPQPPVFQERRQFLGEENARNQARDSVAPAQVQADLPRSPPPLEVAAQSDAAPGDNSDNARLNASDQHNGLHPQNPQREFLRPLTAPSTTASSPIPGFVEKKT